MKLHTYGFLRDSFRLTPNMEGVRTLWRVRGRHVEEAERRVQHMQKALTCECDAKPKDYLAGLESRVLGKVEMPGGAQDTATQTGKARKHGANAPPLDLTEELVRICGVDLTPIGYRQLPLNARIPAVAVKAMAHSYAGTFTPQSPPRPSGAYETSPKPHSSS